MPAAPTSCSPCTWASLGRRVLSRPDLPAGRPHLAFDRLPVARGRPQQLRRVRAGLARSFADVDDRHS
eukprot:11737133-Alexandrium_andersonii.AAC.1